MPLNNSTTSTTSSRTGEDENTQHPPYTLEEWIDDVKQTIHHDIGRTLHRFNKVLPRTRWLVHGGIDIMTQCAMAGIIALGVWWRCVVDSSSSIYVNVLAGILWSSIVARMFSLLPLVVIHRNQAHYHDFLFHGGGDGGDGLLEQMWYVVRLALRHDIVRPSRAEIDRIADGVIQARMPQMRDYFEVELGRMPTMDEASEVMRRLHSCVLQEWSRDYLLCATAALGVGRLR